MARIPPRDKKIVWAISIGIGVALALLAFINMIFLRTSFIVPTDHLIFIAVIVALFPPSIVNYVDERWKTNVDKNIPEFLRELSEAGRTGVTLTRALELASKRRYGPLSDELENINVKLSWGGSLEEALKDFATRVGTTLAKRTSILLTEIYRSGGEIKDVLEMISMHIGELQTIDEERVTQLRNYIAIIYFAFFLFIFIDFLLLRTLFSEIAALKETMSEAGSLFAGGLNIDEITTVMFHMSLIQGLFGGLVAGKMGEGSIENGMKHSLILMGVGYLIFYIMVWR